MKTGWYWGPWPAVPLDHVNREDHYCEAIQEYQPKRHWLSQQTHQLAAVAVLLVLIILVILDVPVLLLCVLVACNSVLLRGSVGPSNQDPRDDNNIVLYNATGLGLFSFVLHGRVLYGRSAVLRGLALSDGKLVDAFNESYATVFIDCTSEVIWFVRKSLDGR